MWAIYLAVCVGGTLTVARTAQLLFGFNAAKNDDKLHLEGQ